MCVMKSPRIMIAVILESETLNQKQTNKNSRKDAE